MYKEHKTCSYREQAKEIVDPRLFEEKLIDFRREHIPGPVRRILGIIFLIPVYLVSFVLSIPAALIGWIFFANSGKFLSLGWYQGEWDPSGYCRLPLIRGTISLFFDRRNFFVRYRQDTKNKAEK